MHLNRTRYAAVDHHSYVLAGDGCLLEGIGLSSVSPPGRRVLGKLVAYTEDNGISIDGEVLDRPAELVGPNTH